MVLSVKELCLDCGKTAEKLVRFIKEHTERFQRRGVVVALSGGLDSTTTAALAVRAVGAGNVTALLLPEKQGNPDAADFAGLAAEKLGINTETIDITPALKAVGTYNFILSHIPGKKVREGLVRLFLHSGREDVLKNGPFFKGIQGGDSRLFRHGYAVMNSKHRVRMVYTMKYAEEHNLLVIGNAHKTEDFVGLFTKFGVDDLADIMPLKNLYRTQVLQLAEWLEVPSEIIDRTPNPDIIPGVTDKYIDILGIDSNQLDLILVGLERGMNQKIIAEQIGSTEEKVGEIEELMELTFHMRHPSIAPS